MGRPLEFITKDEAGSFLLVPPYMPRQELDASDTEDLQCVPVRSGIEEIVVNLPDLDVADDPEWTTF